MTAEGPRALAPDRLDRPFDDPLFDRLFPPLPAGVNWGLDRVRNALAELGDPQDRVPAVHIAGTNGKGSVCSMVASVLHASGRRVGLYTSPHLCSVRERFQVGGRPIAEARLIELADEIRPVVEAHGLTFFEAATVLAFHAFAAEGVDIQVIEVGLGGRLDATNVLTPAVCVLTNVDDDHAEFLGNTLAEIAGEKAGILKVGVPAVTAERGDDAIEVIRRRAGELGIDLHELAPLAPGRLEMEEDHTGFHMDSDVFGALDVRIPLVGRHQATNAALAVAALERLPEALRPSSHELVQGLRGVRWPGRDQIEHIGGRTWILDVAHNTAGVESLTAVLDRLDLPHPRVALIGVLGDKSWEEMLPPLLGRVDAAVLTQPPSAPDARRWDPREAVKRAQEAAPDTALEVIDDFSDALHRARTRAGEGTVVVTGSCHTVGDALRALDRVPYADDA